MFGFSFAQREGEGVVNVKSVRVTAVVIQDTRKKFRAEPESRMPVIQQRTAALKSATAKYSDHWNVKAANDSE